MNHMEDEIKKRFEKANSLEGVDPEGLWENISETLPKVTPSDERNRRFLYLWWILGFIVLGLFASVYIWGTKQDGATADREIKELAIIPQNNDSGNAENFTQLKQADNSEAVSESMPASEGNQNTIFDNAGSATVPLSNISDLNLQSPTQLLSNEKNISDEISKQDDLIDDKNESFKSNKKNDERGFISEIIVHSIPVLPLRPFGEEKNILSAMPPIDPVKNKRWRLGLMAGGNFFTSHFHGQNTLLNFDETLNNSHRGKLGNSIAIYGEWQWNEKIFLSTGLEYFSTRTRFDIVQEWDTVMWRNNIPNSELIDAQAVRTVVHHNRQDYLAVPLMVGTSKEMGRLRAGISGGTAVNFFISQKGRTLDAAEKIVDIGGPELPFRKTFISFQVNPHINYRLSKNLDFRLQSMLRWQPHGQSGFYGLRQNTLLMGVSTGVFINL